MKKNQPPAAPAPDPNDDRFGNDSDFQSIIEQLPEARRVSVRRMNEETDRWAHVGSLSIDTFSEDTVQRRFGGGLYQFQFHGSDGKVIRKLTNIEIADAPDDERLAKTIAPAVTVSERPASSIEEMMRLQMAQQQTMILKLIEAMGQRSQPQQSMVEMVNALAGLKALEPKHQNPPEVQELLMKSFTQGLELAGKLQGKATGETSTTGELIAFARDVFKDALPLIQSTLQKQNPPAVPSGIAAIAPAVPLDNPPDEEIEMDLRPAVAYIKDRLNDGIPPAVLAKLVLQSMDSNPQTKEDVTAIVMEQDLSEIVTLDAELSVEPMRGMFAEFYGVLRARLSADTPAS